MQGLFLQLSNVSNVKIKFNKNNKFKVTFRSLSEAEAYWSKLFGSFNPINEMFVTCDL